MADAFDSTGSRRAALSRRAFIRNSLGGGAAAGAAVIAGCSTLGLPKVSKQNARYQDRPNGKQQCQNCVHFVAPNSCTVVAGDISPNGWSTYYMAKLG